MILYPNYYFNNVKDITVELLNENNIRGLMLDVDNTLIDINRKMLDGLEEWIELMKKNDIKLCILSNTNKRDKVKEVADKLNLPYIHFGLKPLKKGFKKAKAILNLEYTNIAIVGDQIFTDVLGGNRLKMKTILVKPLAEEDIFITLIKRPIEEYIIKKYERSRKG